MLVKVENASAEYDSTVAFGKEGILLIEPIRYDGKIINFSGDKVHISVIYMEDGIKPLIWEGCRMQTVQAGKERYHAIVCKRDGMKWNADRHTASIWDWMERCPLTVQEQIVLWL